MRGQQVTVTVGTSFVQLLPPNPKRKCLILSGDGSNTITISFNAIPVSGSGLVLVGADTVQRVSKDDIGELICEQINCISNNAGSHATAIEGFD